MKISSTQSIPSLSEDGLYARDVFHMDFTDFFFYVEDEDQENFYLLVLKALYPKIRFEQVFALGGKENVLAHWRTHSRHPMSKPAIYLLDKDYDDILGRVQLADNLVYLQKYSIENYLLQEDAFIDLVVEEFPKKKRKEVKATLALSVFIPERHVDLARLTILFVIAQANNLEIESTSQSVEKFTDAKERWKILPERIESYAEKVRQLLKARDSSRSKVDIDAYIATCKQKLMPIVEANNVGKHLMSLMSHYLSHKMHVTSIKSDSFCYRLAKNCAFGDLSSYLSDRTGHIVQKLNKER